MQTLLDGTDPNRSTVAAAAASRYFGEVAETLVQERIARTGAQAPGKIAVTPRLLYNPALKTAPFLIPGILAMLLVVVTTIVTAMGLAREREMGTLEQVLVTPIRPVWLLLGKMLPYVGIGFLDVLLVNAAAGPLFDVPMRGSLPVLALGTLLYLCSTLAVGLLVSTLSQNQQQAFLGGFLFALPAILLSGVMTPVRSMPEWLQWVTVANPCRWYAELARSVLLRGAGFADLWRQLLALRSSARRSSRSRWRGFGAGWHSAGGRARSRVETCMRPAAIDRRGTAHERCGARAGPVSGSTGRLPSPVLEIPMQTTRALMLLSAAVTIWAIPPATEAWDREHAGTFVVLPDGSGGPEGLEVDPQGNVYVASFGFTASGPLAGEGRLFVYDRRGKLQREVSIAGSSSHLLGIRWRAATGTLLVSDFGGQRVLDVNPVTGESTVFLTLPALPAGASASLNDLTFDQAGNVYVSDSFQGTIWRTGPAGGVAQAWVESALLRTTGVPPFGANGLRFNAGQTALFVANTGSDAIVKIPVSGGAPGTPEIFVHGINGADGIIVDRDDNLWVAANQADEIVVVDPTGRAIAKLGDFGGAVRNGVPKQLLFPASLRFLDDRLLVTNLALDLRLFDPTFLTVDSPWCALVTRYTVSVLPARIPQRGDHKEREGDDER